MKRMLIAALFIAGAAHAEVTALSAQAMTANIMYVGCVNAAEGNADVVAVAMFPAEPKDRVKLAIATGSQWHRDNPTSDCTQIYINVIDNLMLGDEI